MKDRFTRGFLSGIIAGIPTAIFALLGNLFKWTTIRWVDFAAILIYGRKSINLIEYIFSVMAVFFICAMLGVIIAYIIPRISSTNYLLKCFAFGELFWFFAFVVTFLFRVPGLTMIPGKSAISNFIMSAIWGLSLGYCLKWFDRRLKE